MAEPIRIKEYESLARDHDFGIAGYQSIPAQTFDALETFLLKNQTTSVDGSQAWDYLSLSVRRGVKVISAKNYVGLIAMADGTNIEILPKISGATDSDTVSIFQDMLRTMADLPFRSFQQASLHTEEMPLLEIFIKMFLKEVGRLIRQGIKFGYVTNESNEKYLKGHIVFSEHVRKNLVHKERFYVQYDEYETDRPENRLIKSTLRYVSRCTKEARTQKDCREYLSFFENVKFSKDYRADFDRCIRDRNMREYDTILRWCRVFLFNQSFTIFKGDEVAFALLFPMEQLFESYVATKLRCYLDAKQFKLLTQDQRYYIFDEPKRFALRPDIVVIDKDTDDCVVLDTKWKKLSLNAHNYGISQQDMMQMYVYHKKYDPERVILVYPYSDEFADKEAQFEYKANKDDTVTISTIFFDLLDVDGSLERLEFTIRGTHTSCLGISEEAPV